MTFNLYLTCYVSCKQFKGCHIAKNIYSRYEGIVQMFGIESYIASDNASNMLKALNFPFPDLRSQQPVRH